MARPRLPAAKAETSGAAIKNAGRFKDRKTAKHRRPVGEPYASMTDPQKVVWAECAAEMPWLTSAHRLLLRQVCMLSARMDDPDMGVSALQALGSLLSKLGATPVDETKVSHGDDEGEDDPADKYFNRGRPN